MPARQKMTPVEIMIVLAILGILASIMLPAMNQAQQGSRSRGVDKSRSRTAVTTPSLFDSSHVGSDGQLNTIEVSELSRSAPRRNPGQWIGVVAGLVPIAISIAVVFIILGRFRQQMMRRRAH